MKRRLAAILAADVAGYTALMGNDEAGTHRRLTDLRRGILDPLIDEHDGRIFKLMGDGLLVEFPSVVDAINCALAWQEGMIEQGTATEEEKRLRFRIGINLGDVIVEGDDIHGDGVNIAARLEGLAEPGGIYVSDDAHRQARGKVESSFEDLGEQNLKNVAEPVRVFRISEPSTGTCDSAPVIKPSALSQKPSIAVLPFANMSSDPEQEYFSDGITEEIITELSRSPGVFVIARNSTFAYKGSNRDARQISRELGVRFILEGSVRRAGNRVRVNSQLIESGAGSHLWSERFDRDLDDIFVVQDDITRNVVSAIAPQIEIAELERARRGQLRDVTSYEIALKAKSIMFDGLGSMNYDLLKQAIATADEALTHDSRNVQALWTQGFAYHILSTVFGGPDTVGYDELALKTARRLSNIDASDPNAYMIRGVLAWDRGEHDMALSLLHRAEEISPNFSWNLISLAWCESLAGETTVAKEHAWLGLRLSPRDLDFWIGTAYLAIAQAHFAEADYTGALKFGLKALEFHETAAMRRSIVTASSAFLGSKVAAVQHLQRLMAHSPDFVERTLSGNYSLFAVAEHQDRLVEGLQLATQYEDNRGL